tara:strand:- start:2581 stop:2823 length:243 start_codon:yes stop_codon:yes gene_type:complete
MKKIQVEMNEVISELERKGIEPHSHISKDTKGLGDAVEDVLKSFGITEERFKQWFNLKECNCTKRKKWLNGLFTWKVKDK